MKMKYIPCAECTKQLDSAELREAFLLDDLFVKGEIKLYYIDCERAVVGSACPENQALKLEAAAALRCEFFCERREMSALNLGGKGAIIVDGIRYELDRLELLYIGKGSREISFESEDSANGAEFYLVSYPAHASYPTCKSEKGDANIFRAGTPEQANMRTLNQLVCEARIKSCQLVTGFTHLDSGSVWNTMPSHTHERRSELYMYFDIEPTEAVIHLMGRPDETRHLLVRNKNVVISPSWSIHSGVGTKNYSFSWAMGGENQRFDDMDPAPTETLR